MVVGSAGQLRVFFFFFLVAASRRDDDELRRRRVRGCDPGATELQSTVGLSLDGWSGPGLLSLYCKGQRSFLFLFPPFFLLLFFLFFIFFKSSQFSLPVNT